MGFTLIDWRGNNYEVEDTVLYPAASGHMSYMQEGVVQDIYQKKRYDWSKDNDLVTKVRVIPGRSSRGMGASTRPVVIQNIENITKVN